MNIIRKENGNHLFCEVNVGEVFEYDDSVFMKIGETSSDCITCSAICLEDGIIMYFEGDELVQLVDADLVIY